MESIISLDWQVPRNVKAYVTTREGGVSSGVYEGFNLGAHVQDLPEAVSQNRHLLKEWLGYEGGIQWLNQVHSADVVSLPNPSSVTADAAYTNQANTVCAVLTADCLPVVFTSLAGDEVAVAHAGWRGLCDGVLEATLAKFRNPADVVACLGPAIGPEAFEVGSEVRSAFMEKDLNAEEAFRPAGHPDKWLGNLYLLARQRLAAAGCHRVSGGDYCTYTDQARFFSYRREGVTGRMATLIWFE